MSSDVSWRSPEGRAAVKNIVTSRIPAWKDGLRIQQEEPILTILDGEDVFLCTATGDGKSALFIVPILCHQEVAQRPHDFPSFPRIRAHPVLLIITPTKGLAGNIVETLEKYDIAALAYNRETIARAHIEGRSLLDEISSCTTYRVICVDPEHLHSADWRKILDVSTFRNNLICTNIEEAHLVIEWSTFRKSYGGIGSFLRGRLPPDVPVSAMSASAEPGAPQTEICQSLGLITRTCRFFRFSNERQDIQFILEPLQHGIKSRDFPQLLPYLNSGRKTIIYGPSFEMVTSIFEYLLRCEPPGVDHGRRVRQYSAICEPEFNAETLRLAETDSELQVLVATVALANGINVLGLDDSISVSMPSTLSQTEQQAGRVARAPDATGRAIVLFQKKDRSDAKKFKAAIASGSALNTAQAPAAGGRGKKNGELVRMDPGKADLLVEKRCLNAVRNERYQNPPLDETIKDCVDVNRPNPCSLCVTRYKLPVTTYAPPPGFRPFVEPVKTNCAPIPRDQKLKKKEEAAVNAKFETFAAEVFEANLFKSEFENRPAAWFFPPSLQAELLAKSLRIDTLEQLQKILNDLKWPFRTSGHRDALWQLIESTRREVLAARPPPKSKTKAPAAARKKSKKRARRNSSPSSESESDSDAVDTASSMPGSELDTDTEANSLPRRIPSLPPLSRSPSLEPLPLLQNVTNHSVRRGRGRGHAPSTGSSSGSRPQKSVSMLPSLMNEMGPPRTNNRRARGARRENW